MIAFIFADLIVVPIVLAYAKYYGWPFARPITLLMLAPPLDDPEKTFFKGR